MKLLPPQPDVEVGMTQYATRTSRQAGKLRVELLDFQVEEQIDLDVGQMATGFPLYRIEKKNIDTIHMARIVSTMLKSRVSYAGLKDKKSVAIQYVSPTSGRAKCQLVLNHQNFQGQIIGRTPRPVTRHDLGGNSFKIRIRDANSKIEDVIKRVYAAARAKTLPNFFGYQRFGSRGAITHKVGEALVKRDFAMAVDVLVAHPRLLESPQARDARALAGEGKFREALISLRPGQDIERAVLTHLVGKDQDFLGALRRIPISVRKLFVNAYQAYVFNLTLSEVLRQGDDISEARGGDCWSELSASDLKWSTVHGVKEKPSEGAVPLLQLPGYAFRDYGSRFDTIELEIMRELGVEPKDFYFKEANELSDEGGFRQAPLLSKNEAHETVEDGVWVSFVLGPAEYATILLREILKPVDPYFSGF
jgi:tRNA pseudouridine13 synthase